MANYYANARTNYFRVKDLARLQSEAESLNLRVVSSSPTDTAIPEGTPVALLAESPDADGWPSYRQDDEDEPTELDFPAWVASHLVDGDVAVIQEVGAEKLRYLVGYAVAINSKGERVALSLDDIYAKAAGLGETITACSY